MFDAQQALDFANTRLDRPAGLYDALADRDEANAWLAQNLAYAPPRPLIAPEHS